MTAPRAHPHPGAGPSPGPVPTRVAKPLEVRADAFDLAILAALEPGPLTGAELAAVLGEEPEQVSRHCRHMAEDTGLVEPEPGAEPPHPREQKWALSDSGYLYMGTRVC